MNISKNELRFIEQLLQDRIDFLYKLEDEVLKMSSSNPILFGKLYVDIKTHMNLLKLDLKIFNENHPESIFVITEK